MSVMSLDFQQTYDSQDLCLQSVVCLLSFSSQMLLDTAAVYLLFEAAVSEAHLSLSTGGGGG